MWELLFSKNANRGRHKFSTNIKRVIKEKIGFSSVP
jgi:hypothetical protein